MEMHRQNRHSTTDSYFQSLSFPPISSIGQLLGKSNFKAWRSSIEPVLLGNPLSSRLILGGEWSDPRAATASSHGVLSEQERDEWHAATVATCRFIRATLALNVAPFVRQHNTAKALYLNLVWLYGPEAGIDTQGGPTVSSPGALMQQQDPRRTRAGLLAAMESKTPLGETMINVPGRLPPPPSSYSHPHAKAAVRVRPQEVANLGSSLSTTSLLLTNAATTTPSPSASASASASANVTDLIRPDSQVLPVETKPHPVRAIIDALPSVPFAPPPSPPSPPAMVHVYERMRKSPDPSLQTIHEEPHPGTKVTFSRAVVATTTEQDVSPVSPGDNGRDDDVDDDSLSPLEDTDEEDMSISSRCPPIKGSKQKYHADSSLKEKSRSIFTRTAGTSVLSATNESSKTRKLSISFPLRKLNKDSRSKSGGK
ncbi:hypothetical protein LTS17_008992 [Exophiala oligosperma]